jgi:aquaporin Z
MNKYLVEFLGTMFFIYVILATGNPLAIGAAFIIAMLLTKNMSGGNFNPAVTIALVMSKKIAFNDMLPYILVQVAGGLAALELYKKVN